MEIDMEFSKNIQNQIKFLQILGLLKAELEKIQKNLSNFVNESD